MFVLHFRITIYVNQFEASNKVVMSLLIFGLYNEWFRFLSAK